MFVSVHLPDWFKNGHGQRPGQVLLNELPSNCLIVVPTPPPCIPCVSLLSRTLGFQDNGCVGLFTQDEGHKKSTCADENNPVNPPPSQILVNESAYDRACGHLQSALLRVP